MQNKKKPNVLQYRYDKSNGVSLKRSIVKLN